MFISLKAASRCITRAVQAGRIPPQAKVRFKRTSKLNSYQQDRGWIVFIRHGNVSYQFKPKEE